MASAMVMHWRTSASVSTNAILRPLLHRVAADEEVGVFAGRRGEPSARVSLAQDAHLIVVDAHVGLTNGTTVEPVQPVLVLPHHAVHEARAQELRPHLLVRLAGR